MFRPWTHCLQRAALGVAALLMALGGIAGCAVSSPENPPEASPVTPGVAVTPAWQLSQAIGGEWQAVAIAGMAQVMAPAPRLRWISRTQVQGSGGCNQFVGQALLSDDAVRIGPLAATRMLCVASPAGQEDRFFSALEATVRIVPLSDGQLQLRDAQGAEVARLSRP